METNESPTRISRGTGVLDDLMLLVNSLPSTTKSTVIADIKFVFAELSCDTGDNAASATCA
jgi:hypothetical protein